MKVRLYLLFFLASFNSFSQPHIKPGFDTNEYLDLLSLAFYSSSIPDSAERVSAKDPYTMVYRSPEVGLLNRWSMYMRNDQVGTIDIRGTVAQTTSWLANFYAAMIPAKGILQLNDSTFFEYQLAADPKAMVHVGWTVALAFMGPEIVKKINEQYKEKHIREFIIFGHSQGGAIAFLLRSYLYYEMLKGNIPNDILFKTYCSAAPKPGNMYYAYDYDFINRGYWSHTVVNASDWVPESPFSIQTLKDFNDANPFVNVKPLLKKQKFLIRIAGNMVYNKLNRSTRKAQSKMQKYLGTKMYKLAIRKALPGFTEPTYSGGNNFMRAGTPVILMGDDEYHRLHPTDSSKPFGHHMFEPYAFLVKRIYGAGNSSK